MNDEIHSALIATRRDRMSGSSEVRLLMKFQEEANWTSASVMIVDIAVMEKSHRRAWDEWRCSAGPSQKVDVTRLRLALCHFEQTGL
jgi:hypothetical protein